MRIIVTGATGFIGRQIIPLLQENGVELLLIGRNKGLLKELFPDIAVTDYDNFCEAAIGFDALLHLAVMNNDQEGSLDDFRKVNVELLNKIIEMARVVKIGIIINTTTVHTSHKVKKSLYAQTKFEAERLLSDVKDITIVNLRLPAVYGINFKGKLAILNKFPAWLAQILFQVLASLKPTANINLVAASVLESAKLKKSAELLVSDRQQGNKVYAIVKRAIDLSFAFFVIVFLWWILIAAWFFVKFSSRGPGIFKQDRIGKSGKKFVCYKFRTMYLGTKESGTHELTRSTVTPVGRFLRKSKIDELPQIWNIIKNELSLVGPRPCLPTQNTLINERKSRGIYRVKAGITGLAQVSGVDMSEPQRLSKVDADYIVLRSLVLDIKIIFATIIGQGKGDKIRDEQD